MCRQDPARGLVGCGAVHAAAADEVGVDVLSVRRAAPPDGEARDVAREAGLRSLLDARRRVDVATYDAIEDERDRGVMAKRRHNREQKVARP